MKDTAGKRTTNKVGFVPFACGLIIKSRENSSLQNSLEAGSVWCGSSENGKVTSIESGQETFRRDSEGRGNWARLWEACGRAVGGRDSCERENVVLSKEPEFSSGEAVEASRDVHVDPLLFQSTCTSVLFRNAGPLDL